MHAPAARLPTRRPGLAAPRAQRLAPSREAQAAPPRRPQIARAPTTTPARRPARVSTAASPPPRPPGGPPTRTTSSAARAAPLRFAGLAAAVAALAAAAAVAGREPLADALAGGGGDLLDLDAPAPLRLGFVAGALLWAAALRLVSIPQLLLLFIGRVDGARPVDTVERLLSLAAGPDGPTTPGQLAAVRAGGAAVFLASGALVSALLAAGLGGDDTWAVASGLGALAAGGLFDLGRPRPQTGAEAAAADARAASFAAWAEAGSLRRGGQCFEGEVFAAARRPGGPARGWTDEEVRAALRAWAVSGPGSGGRAVSRSAAGFWKGVSVVPGGGRGGVVGVADLAPPPPPPSASSRSVDKS
jgi:hypothetical protein